MFCYWENTWSMPESVTPSASPGTIGQFVMITTFIIITKSSIVFHPLHIPWRRSFKQPHTEKHIDRTCAKANRQLAFLRRNLQIQNPKFKETAYFGLVRPFSEYCATVWDPHFQKYIDQIEAIQRRAARFVNNNYDRVAPVTEMVNELGCDQLEHEDSELD